MRVLDARQLDDRGFAKVLALVQAHDRRIDPVTDPVTALELKRLILHDRTEANRHERFAAFDAGGRACAFGHIELESDVSNRHFASAEITGAASDPAAGRAVLAAMIELAKRDGRSTLLGWGPASRAEEAFWTNLGADRRYHERISALDVTAVDDDLMQSWIERRTERAGDVRLIRWTDTCPDAHVAAFAACVSALNDAPLEGIEMNEWSVDTSDVREDEEAHRALGMTTLTIFAADPDGSPVGYTQIRVNPFRPDASWQWGTAVLEQHRRRGVGRWIKAEMWRWLRTEAPYVHRLLTGNAESNAAMLAINEAMGFRPAMIFGAWQAGIDTYRAALEKATTSPA